MSNQGPVATKWYGEVKGSKGIFYQDVYYVINSIEREWKVNQLTRH